MQNAKALLDKVLDSDFIKQLQQEQNILVPRQVIHHQMNKAISGQEGVEMQNCEFSSDGIRLSLEADRAGAEIAFPIDFNVSEVAINGKEQRLDLETHYDKPVGQNIIGKIAIAIGTSLLYRMLSKKIAESDFINESNIKHNDGHVRLDLSELPKLQPLKKKVPILNWCALDLISIYDYEHVAEGIKFKGKLAIEI